MGDIYERIDKVRIELGLSYKELGDLFGISGDATRKAIIDRKNLKEIYINTFSDKFNVSKEYLKSGVGERYIKESVRDKKKEAEFNSLPISDQLYLMYKRQLDLDEKLNKVMEYIEDLTEPFYEYIKLNKGK